MYWEHGMRQGVGKFLLLSLYVFAFSLIPASCGGGNASAIFTAALLDELFGTERSSIYVENAVSRINLKVGEEFQLRVIHRQIRSDSYYGYYGRYYYEEDVTEESDYSSSNPSVAGVSSDGLIIGIGPGTAEVSVKFDLPLQKADKTSIEVVVTK